MFCRNMQFCAYLSAITIILAASCILGQPDQLLYRKPWPTYSLQNMPQTRFTCHDKILGGYYADAETQCQMFHVCVKVAGVGVQDFRFLCPNGTAFDQEAQICADWGDVDCEQSVLYYGSDNFDLYRLGSGFESKRAPLAEEDEATFHLQRAESADIRRSKETRVDQKSRPEQPPNYTKRFEATTRHSFNSYANSHANNRNQHQQQQQQQQQPKPNIEVAPKKPLVNFYTPTSSSSSSTTAKPTTTTTTEHYNDESKQEFDEIFRGSHSSHFFSNRNGGREDDLADPQPAQKAKFNDFTDYSKKTETSTTSKVRSQPARGKRIKTTSSATTSTTKAAAGTTSTSALPKITKKFTLQTSFNSDFSDFTQTVKSTTAQPTASPLASTQRPSNNNSPHRFSSNANDYLTHEKIQPTTYNPGNSFYHLKTTTTPKYAELNRGSDDGKSTTSRRIQKNDGRAQQKLSSSDSTFVNPNEFAEFSKLSKSQQAQHKLQQPQPFQPSLVFSAPTATPERAAKSNQKASETASRGEPQYFRSRGHQTVQSGRVGHQEPAPFSAAPAQRHRSAATKEPQVSATASPSTTKPRGFTSRGSINYKATTQRNNGGSAATTQGVKKFSTHVPKEQYSPTTYKPTTYKKAYENNYYQTQQTVKPAGGAQKPVKTTPVQSALPVTTANPYYSADEDDGQYHPELYEIDFPQNRLHLQRSSTAKAAKTSRTTITSTTTTTTIRPLAFTSNFHIPQTHLKTQQQEQGVPDDLSDEDELFKTAHSLNFGAASINKLRADIIKAEKTSQQYNSQYSPNGPSSSPKTVAISTQTTTPSTTAAQYTYSTYSTAAVTTKKPYYNAATSTSTTTTTTTTPRPIAKTTKTAQLAYEVTQKSTKPTSGKSPKNSGKGKKSKSASKRPPHADADTSYDYAYYDTDSLSESPQDYQEYEIAEFSRTRKN